MASDLTTKVRLVRCPKCSLVLPELPDFNVYKCGGCGATLQAKHRVNIARSTETGLNDAVARQENQTDRVHKGKECCSTNKDILPSFEECSSFQNHESDQSQSGDCDGEQPHGMSLSLENQNNRSRQSNSSDCDNEGSEASHEVFSPTDFVDDKSEEFTPNGNSELANAGTNFTNHELEHNENGELADNEEESADDENKRCDDNVNEEFVHCEIEEFARHNENEDSSQEFVHDKNEDLSQEFARTENEEFTQDKNAECGHTENESQSLARADLEAAVNEENSTLAEANAEDTKKKIDSDSKVRSSNSVKFVAVAGSVSNASDHVPARERLTSDTLASCHGELKQPQKSVHRVYSHLSSKEFNPSSELSGTLGETSKSPTRSSHAYDGSISSYEGVDDQLPSHQLHSFEDAHKAPNFLHSGERPRRDKFVERTMMNRDFDMQHQAKPSWSDKKNRAVRNGNWDRNEFQEPDRHDRTARNWRPERHDHQTSLAFHRIGPRGGYEMGGPSNPFHEKFQRHSSFQSDWSEDREHMMKLLKMVFEMQNQHDKSCSLYDKGKDRISGRSQKTRYDPRYYNYDTHREEHFHRSNDPRYLGRYASGSSYSKRCRPKKIPFSGGAISSSHQLDPSCSHCFPQEWLRSTQVPPPSRYNTAGLCMIHPGHSYCTCYSSFPPSPQWSVDFEYPPWRREMQSDDHHRRSQDMTSYFLREKHRAAKRHFRPIAGGAPFIVCYKCHIVLQLPADFLLFKKKCHQLRCGTCAEVLKFSLKQGCHIVRYRANVADPPPPTEADDRVNDVNRRNAASTSQTPRGDPVSYSDDYGTAHHKSCSTEGDSASYTPIQTPLGRAFDRILYGYDPSGGSKELAPEQSPGRYKNRPPRYEPPRPSSGVSKSKKLSSEIADEPPRSTSPLHRLMGYSSPSQVMFGSRPYDQEASSSYSMQQDQ